MTDEHDKTAAKDEDAEALRSFAATQVDAKLAVLLEHVATRIESQERLLKNDKGTRLVWRTIAWFGGAVILGGLAHYVRLMATDAGWNRAEKFAQLSSATPLGRSPASSRRSL